MVIFRASERPEVGPFAHLPVPEHAHHLRGGPTVLRTVCGQVGIGRVFEQPAVSCGLCLAATGEHPGRRSKAHLRRLSEGR